jgi:hypothetical protein
MFELRASPMNRTINLLPAEPNSPGVSSSSRNNPFSAASCGPYRCNPPRLPRCRDHLDRARVTPNGGLLQRHIGHAGRHQNSPPGCSCWDVGKISVIGAQHGGDCPLVYSAQFRLYQANNLRPRISHRCSYIVATGSCV